MRAQIKVLTPNRALFRKNEIPDSLKSSIWNFESRFCGTHWIGQVPGQRNSKFQFEVTHRHKSFIFSPRFHRTPVTNDLHSSTSNTHFCHCFIIITMSNVSKRSNALLSANSSTSTENDTLQAAQEDSKEEDAINNDVAVGKHTISVVNNPVLLTGKSRNATSF